MYDAIVVGARCAGSPTAMLLARRGYSVLLLDRAGFPSDVLSTHYVHQPGAASLNRWGLLDRVVASGCPPIERQILDIGPFALAGTPPPADDIAAAYAPRRTVLDKILLDAAVESGVEVREHFSVEGLLTNNGRVTGIRGRSRGGGPTEEKARIVIGADGVHSVVARLVGAPMYDEQPAYNERIRAGTRAEKFRGSSDLSGFFRRPYGRGWALVGDAGYHKNPITAAGITDAFRDAEFLTDALGDIFVGRLTAEKALASYERKRNETVMPLYQMTCDMAKLEPPRPEMQNLFSAFRDNEEEFGRFVGTMAGTVPIPEFFSPENLQRITGTMWN